MNKILGVLSLGVILLSVACSCSRSELTGSKISLAQWSLHKAFFAEELSTLDFPRIAKEEFNIDAVEYVSQFFANKAEDRNYLQALKDSCEKYEVKSLLIMVDGEGALASKHEAERDEAVLQHKKWVDAAQFLDCLCIRVNLHSETKLEDEWIACASDGLAKLVSYASSKGVSVIVENHGQLSSKGYLVAKVIENVDSEYCGSLPDFGNFCVRRRDGDLWVSPCVEWYDRYKGIEEMLPYAKGISAKAFEFDEQGQETTIDYKRMFALIQNSGYSGYIGIEYEGENLSEYKGIRKTKALIEASLQ